MTCWSSASARWTPWTTSRHGAAVVIRAHGVKPEVMDRATSRGLEVIDGTCTWVIQEQRQLQKLVDEGYTIVLLGTPKHPEVVGLLGFAPDAIVVDEEEDWDRIPRRKRMALITQSTQPPWKFEKLAGFMVSRAHELKIVNTVCPVTIRRQEDTLETARDVDLMVVVGGRHSANTKELTRLCEMAGTTSVQIESST
jgi:(E)-4-hydroxy-3-methyl-but-2-enyl pyrophosphate reductase